MPLLSRPSFLARVFASVGLAMAFADQSTAQTADLSYRPMTAKEILTGIDDGSLAAGPIDEARKRELSTARATAYILGVADSAVGRQWCRPQSLSIPDLAATVYSYLTALPEKGLGDPAASVVIRALAAKYPCKRPSH